MAQKKVYNRIRLTIAKDYKEMSRIAANIILKKIHFNPDMIFMVPAGTTPIGVYKILRAKSNLFKKSIFLTMDEYCLKIKNKIELIPVYNPVSFRFYMEKKLFDKLKPMATYFPGIENIKKPGSYDHLIKNLGGIDLCVNAVGEDGHTLGFNFPGVSFESKTRLVRINKKTREVNEKLTGLKTPEYAITTGLKTGIQSKEIIFLASGKRKANIIKKIIYAKKPTKKIPATILRKNPKCHWIIDKDAASKL